MPARKAGALSTPELRARRAEVEALMLSGAWSHQAVLDIAQRWSVGDSQIYADRKRIRKGWAREAGGDRETARADLLARVRMAQARASTSNAPGAWGAASQMFRLEADILGLIGPHRVELSVSTSSDDPRAMAIDVLKGLPAACALLGIPIPEIPMLEIIDIEAGGEE